MKRQLITFSLAAFCATAILSCNKETAIDSIGPDTEHTVLLTASIDASTKAVGIDESKVVCTWEIGDTVALVHNNTRISVLKVISVSDDNKAQLSGKVKGAYNEGTEMKLYYGGTDYDYSGQTGTVASAVSKAYLQATTTVQSRSADGKTLTLSSVTMAHQQAYMSLTFYNAATPVNVKSVVITDGGSKIIKTQEMGGIAVPYDEEKFKVESSSEEGQTSFYFALNDTETTLDHRYNLTITTADNETYTGVVAAPKTTNVGNYFADAKVVLEGFSPVITYPACPGVEISYNGKAHNLITPGVVQPGATVYYIVSDTTPGENGWSATVPQATNPGAYKVWYKVDGGYYDDILPTKLGSTIIGARNTTIVPPKVIGGLVYNGIGQALVSAGYVEVANDTPVPGAELQYYVTKDDTTTTPTGATNESGWIDTIPAGINVGTYRIWYRFPGSEYVNAVPMAGPVQVVIATAPGSS